MKKAVLVFVVFCLFCSAGCVRQKYEARWESLVQYECPEWFRDAKFGIYCHWGPYSVPAYKNEWYSHWMYVKGHDIYHYHLGKYGALDRFGYKDFIPLFKAEKFDPKEWADLFVKAGARFAGPVAEHADGFAMWDSDLTTWDAKERGPGRDVVGEMEKAIRSRGLKFITTLHHQWLYAWYPTMDRNTDASNPEYRDLYGPPVPSDYFNLAWSDSSFRVSEEFNQRWIKRAIEVVDKYHPDLVYFDSKLHIIDEQYRIDFLRYFYNSAMRRKQDVVCTYKHEDMVTGAAVLDLERARMGSLSPVPWLTDDSMDWNSWCDVADPEYKSSNRIIDFIVDVVSKNGSVLLNIPPKANGEIPAPVRERLLEIGAWLEVNGEAIYGTRPWKICGEGPTEVVEGHLNERQNKDMTWRDIRFTKKDEWLYIIVLDWPPEGQFQIKTLGGGYFSAPIKNLSFVSGTNSCTWTLEKAGLNIHVNGQKPNDFAYVFKVMLEAREGGH